MAATEKCFVIGPIGAEGSDARVHSDWLYDGIIKPAIADFRARRIDDLDAAHKQGMALEVAHHDFEREPMRLRIAV